MSEAHPLVEDDDSQYVSPTSDDTIQERYEKARKREAGMSNKELLQSLRTTPSFFSDSDLK